MVKKGEIAYKDILELSDGASIFAEVKPQTPRVDPNTVLDYRIGDTPGQKLANLTASERLKNKWKKPINLDLPVDKE